jgi:hypothetical protein
MATPKEQHDARPNARSIGYGSARSRPADATPPGGIRAVSLRDLLADAEREAAAGAPLSDARLGEQVPPEESAERA